MRRLPFVYAGSVRACKPNSVCPQGLAGSVRGGHHLSGTTVAGRFERPTCTGPHGHRGGVGGQPPPTAVGLSSRVGTVLLGLTPRGVCLAAPVAGSAGALLPHPFTPYTDIAWTKSRHRCGTALCCTCHLHRVDRSRCRCSLPVRKHGALWCSDFPHRREGVPSTRTPSAERCPDTHAASGKRRVYARRSGPKGHPCKKAQRLKQPSAPFKGRPCLSSRRPSRCRDPRRR